jgi:hypothetical protein
MFPLTFILLAAATPGSVDAQGAGARIQEAQYCPAVERRAQHREIERVQPTAAAHPTPGRDLSDDDRSQLRQALARLARCTTGKLAYDLAAGFYVPQQKEGCR